MDPLQVNGEKIVHPEIKVEVLVQHFARKLTEGKTLLHGGNSMIRKQIRNRYRKGHWKLEPSISTEEVLLAAMDLPTNKATGPDRIPAEFFYHLPALLEILPGLYTRMVELNKIPFEATKYHILPFDKFGRKSTFF